jgi:hypothetical protein
MADTGMGDFISLEEAVSYTTAFRNKYADFPKAHLAGKEKLIELLYQPNCVAARIYNGANPETGVMNLVVIGVDDKGNDMAAGLILERFGVCPPWCDVRSPLMQS